MSSEIKGKCFYCGKRKYKEEYINEWKLCSIRCKFCKNIERFYQYGVSSDERRIKLLLKNVNTKS